MKSFALNLRLGAVTLVLGASWLLLVPLSLWAVASFYLPLIAPALGPRDQWIVTAIIALLLLLSLLGHALAHIAVARWAGSTLPTRLPLYPFGDAAQVWPAAPTPGREGLVALAGPCTNLLLAGLGYLLWDRQLHPYVDTSALFLSLCNSVLLIVNLAPGFPLDGGRLLRVICGGILYRMAWGTRLACWLGWALVLGLLLWGVLISVQDARFSRETGVLTLLLALLLLLPLWQHPARREAAPDPPVRLPLGQWLGGGAMVALLLLALLGTTVSLFPLLNGVYAPGLAVAVAPMINVAPAYHYPARGSFLLTTVIAQTPITVGQWLYAQLNPAFTIVPPEQVVPPNITPQELVEQSFTMLEESEATATVLALRLAGYSAQLQRAVAITGVLAESQARDLLKAGDQIVALNAVPIATPEDLGTQLAPLSAGDTVRLRIVRDGQTQELAVPLLPPAQPGGAPRIGIMVQAGVVDVELPFPVAISPQKIIGGPSAGLMFTLTIYDLVTPGELSGGWRIAGTGTIDLDGLVGPIGGVEQKVAGAEWAGAQYFLVPREHEADARRVARTITIVPVANVQEALDFLRSLPPAP